MKKPTLQQAIEQLRETTNELSHWHEWRQQTSLDYKNSNGYHETQKIIKNSREMISNSFES